ncbi:MAG: hypothetical protein R2734_02685 [Nocardioides sp.]
MTGTALIIGASAVDLVWRRRRSVPAAEAFEEYASPHGTPRWCGRRTC